MFSAVQVTPAAGYPPPAIEWLAQTQPDLFREYMRPGAAVRTQWLAERLEGLAGIPGAAVIEARSGGDLVAVLGAQPQSWDTEHFGVPCAKLGPALVPDGMSRADTAAALRATLAAGVDWARGQGTRVLQRRLLASRFVEIGVLEDLGFHMVDNVVTLAAPLAEVMAATAATCTDVEVRAMTDADLPALMAMTCDAFPLSRFVNDPVLDPAKGRQLYVAWLGKLAAAASGAAARQSGLIIAGRKDAALGYCAFGIDTSLREALGVTIAAIELIVVAAAARGLGVGRELLRVAALQAAAAGADIMESSTWSGQKAALAANQKAGLRVCETLLTYHRYL